MTVPGPYQGPEHNPFDGHWTLYDTASGCKTVIILSEDEFIRLLSQV